MTDGRADRQDWQDVPPLADPAGISDNSERLGDGPVGPQASLDFALIRAVELAEVGDWQAFVTAMVDAQWLAHTGRHEDVSDHRMVTILRAIAGADWAPEVHGE